MTAMPGAPDAAPDADPDADPDAGPDPSGSPLARAAAAMTVPDLFAQRVRDRADRPAVADETRVVTYAELGARADRLAAALAGRGIGRGDRVAVLSENRIEHVELLLACARRGAILACQNWRQADEELGYCLRLVDPGLVMVSPRFAETFDRLGLDLPRIVFGEESEAMMAQAPAAPPPLALDPEDGLIILYTSGTTGRPKGAVISHRAMLARNQMSIADGVLVPGRSAIAWSPMFHMAATDGVFGALVTGGCVHVMADLDMARLAALVAENELGHLVLMPGMIERFAEAMRADGRPAKGMNAVGVMADLVPRSQIVMISTLLNAPYRNTFGATETGSAPASRGLIPIGEAPERLPKTQSSFCQLRLVDEEGNDVPDGTPGEAAFRGPSLFSGYWNNPQANAESFKGGWFRMGDMLVRNPDGTLDFVDRRKYLIKSGGENIYPAEIERLLLASPRVAEAVVVRRTDPKWGEAPVAFVVPGDAALDEAAVMALLDGRIARYKRPKAVIFIEERDLTRNTTGKILRAPLEARAAAAQGADPAAAG